MTAVFFFMMPMIYLSGFIFPIENMPAVIQPITYLIPLRYYLVIVRGIFLKGVGPRDVLAGRAADAGLGPGRADAGDDAVEEDAGVAPRTTCTFRSPRWLQSGAGCRDQPLSPATRATADQAGRLAMREPRRPRWREARRLLAELDGVMLRSRASRHRGAGGRRLRPCLPAASAAPSWTSGPARRVGRVRHAARAAAQAARGRGLRRDRPCADRCETTADGDGRFEFAGLAPGAYTLAASVPGFTESAPSARDADRRRRAPPRSTSRTACRCRPQARAEHAARARRDAHRQPDRADAHRRGHRPARRARSRTCPARSRRSRAWRRRRTTGTTCSCAAAAPSRTRRASTASTCRTPTTSARRAEAAARCRSCRRGSSSAGRSR